MVQRHRRRHRPVPVGQPAFRRQLLPLRPKPSSNAVSIGTLLLIATHALLSKIDLV